MERKFICSGVLWLRRGRHCAVRYGESEENELGRWQLSSVLNLAAVELAAAIWQAALWAV